MLVIALFLAGVAWRGGLAQPAPQDVPPLSGETAQDRFAAPAVQSEESPPEFHVEVIAFAYGPFDPTEEEFPRARRQEFLGSGTGERRLPSFGLSEEAMRRLFPPQEEFDPRGEPFARPSPDGPSTEPEPPPAPADAPEQTEPLLGPDGGERGSAGESAASELEEFALGGDRNRKPAFAFRLLTPEELTLTAQYGILERLTAYTPLLHGGWVQPGLPEDEARPVDLALLGPANVKGTIRLHLSRFLHVTVNMRYYPGSPTPPPEALADDRFTFPAPPVLEEIELAPRYELVVQRRTRSGELHYFDHPAFGVLVMVSPRPEEPEEEANDILSPAA